MGITSDRDGTPHKDMQMKPSREPVEAKAYPREQSNYTEASSPQSPDPQSELLKIIIHHWSKSQSLGVVN